ncbi:sensor histidine kinase [Roseateles sp. DAIF2]|uniref:sensor histidine kinase n=1 Tax=Roseateles sp. DAIF2 TaxID=2714952 RepID=UPI0018A27543|nr:histidine kinase [Roseateles sp. DAIF2]QPF73824.1 sensor histidine kinase [Roseateles sp. DAIF2]
MNAHDSLRLAWQRYWKLHRRRPEPAWARLLITAGLGLMIPSFFLLLAHLFGNRQINGASVLASLGAGLFIAGFIHAGYRLCELLLPERGLRRLNGGGWLANCFFIAMPIVGVTGGTWTYWGLLAWITRWQIHMPFDNSRAASQFLFILVCCTALGSYMSWQAERRQRLQLQATEARLLHLQAQIEPHFLFNSLAAVQSLIDVAPERAKLMLERFTDHLRLSLDSLRNEFSSLEQELALAESYLALMGLRMGEARLRYRIEVPAALRALSMPPLLLQPLVENAITHGLEAKPEGGLVRIEARLEQDQLLLIVEDDGLGSAAAGPRRRARPGQGLALKNIRERLEARYGDQAHLTLHPGPAGCVAELHLPAHETP